MQIGPRNPFPKSSHPDALTFVKVPETSLLRDIGVKLGLCAPSQEAVLNPQVFRERYCQEVQHLLSAPVAPDNLEQAYQMALAGLPPLEAAALAGEVARTLVSPQAEREVALATRGGTNAGLTGQVEKGCERAGVPIPTRVWVIKSDEMEACAGFGSIGVASSYLDPSRQARLHFVVGHELSHSRHRDDIAMLGFEALAQGISQPLLSYAVKQDLRALYHAMELRSDRDGLAYAQAQRVDQAELLHQMSDLLGQEQESDTHPSGRQRLQALRRSL